MIFSVFQKNCFLGILGPHSYGIGATIRIGRILSFVKFNFPKIVLQTLPIFLEFTYFGSIVQSSSCDVCVSACVCLCVSLLESLLILPKRFEFQSFVIK